MDGLIHIVLGQFDIDCIIYESKFAAIKSGVEMKKNVSQALFALLMLLPVFGSAAQDENPYGISFSATNTVENEDVMNLYRFQNVQVAKLKFSGKGLWGKNYRLYIQEFIDGKPQPRSQIFDSREDEFFRLKEQEFGFNVLAQRSNDNKVRFDFRFLGFGLSKEFKVAAEQKDFILRSSQDGEEELEVPNGKDFTILSFIMPHKNSRGSLRYSDFDPLSVRPDALGKKFGIPRYYIVQIRFD